MIADEECLLIASVHSAAAEAALQETRQYVASTASFTALQWESNLKVTLAM